MGTNWQIGDKIENCWEIHKILKGGMGIVYVVHDVKSGARYAAKTFQDEVFAQSDVIAARFNQEALTWINLDTHQNITKAYFVNRFETPFARKPFLFLEYVTGGDLSRWIGTRQLTENLPQVLLFAIQFCDGMIHALSKGVKAHRDIKPQNCLISEDGQLKVTDFGLAKVFDDVAQAKSTLNPTPSNLFVSQTGSVAGTPHYMAPGQFEHAKHVDIRADIYSFGIMLCEMVTGELPFRARTWENLKRCHKMVSPPRVDHRSKPLNTIVQTCLAKKPSRRFSDFSVVRRELAVLYVQIAGFPAPSGSEPTDSDAVREAMHLSDKGISLAQLGRDDEAIVYLNKALDLNAKEGTIWMNKGILLLRKRRTDEALACFDRAIALDPNNSQAWLNKGNAFRESGKPDDALTCYDRAIELEPDYARAWHNKGSILMDMLGRQLDAIPCFEQAAKFGLPESARLIELCKIMAADLAARAPTLDTNRNWVNEAISLAQSGSFAEALKCFDRALECKPDDEVAWANKGAVLSELGNEPEALACYDKALKLNPQYAHAWYLKGALLGPTLHRWQEAVDCYDRAIKIDASFEKAWCNKAAALSELGQLRSAVECYQTTVRLDHRDAFAWNNMAGLMFSLGLIEDAIRLYEQAKLLGHPRAAIMLERCRQELAAGTKSGSTQAEESKRGTAKPGLFGKLFGKRRS